mmetsp:Transcript_46957/g.147643  ORF Transcript_46957/g.147643 Transcript_46957/m.147643 type:complete len:207 (+) Transcript_46957:214-834(+)
MMRRRAVPLVRRREVRRFSARRGGSSVSAGWGRRSGRARPTALAPSSLARAGLRGGGCGWRTTRSQPRSRAGGRRGAEAGPQPRAGRRGGRARQHGRLIRPAVALASCAAGRAGRGASSLPRGAAGRPAAARRCSWWTPACEAGCAGRCAPPSRRHQTPGRRCEARRCAAAHSAARRCRRRTRRLGAAQMGWPSRVAMASAAATQP